MGIINQLAKTAKKVQKNIYNLYEKFDKTSDAQSEGDLQQHIDSNKDMLRSTLRFSTYAPLIIYSYIFLYGLYTGYTIIKTIVIAPIQLILGILNIALESLKLFKSSYVTMHSLVVVFIAYIFTLNEDIFDISFMYHLIRGQSTVKVYAIIFAIQSSEVVLTKIGVFLYQNIKQKSTNKDISFYKLFPQFIVESLYIFCHAYIIYIDFLIFNIVLNSSFQSFVIFWSVVYLTKMKAVPSFGLEINKYKSTLTSDSKYRISRVIFLILFLSNQIWASVPFLGYKCLFIVFMQQFFIICKHLIYLLSSYKGSSDTSIIEIREDMYKTMYLDSQSSSLDKCVYQNFTVLPVSVFLIKMLTVTIRSSWEPNFLAYFTFYIILCILAGIFIVLIIGIKSIERFAQQMRKKNEVQSPFINSICIDVIGRIIQVHKDSKNIPFFEDFHDKTEESSPPKSQSHRSDLKFSPLKMKKSSSFLESLLIHAQQIRKDNIEREKREQKQKQDLNKPYDESLQEQDKVDQEFFINDSKIQKKSRLELRKTQSHF